MNCFVLAASAWTNHDEVALTSSSEASLTSEAIKNYELGPCIISI